MNKITSKELEDLEYNVRTFGRIEDNIKYVDALEQSAFEDFNNDPLDSIINDPLNEINSEEEVEDEEYEDDGEGYDPFVDGYDPFFNDTEDYEEE